MTLGAHLKSALSLAVITANLGFWIALAFPLSVVRLALPGFRPALHGALEAIYRTAVRIDDFWLRRVIGIRWSLPALALDRSRTYIVVSNHVSWADIFLVQSLLVEHGFVVKFLTKRNLIALPIVGLILWAFEFPLVRRTSRRASDEAERRQRDFEALREACRSARENPVALVSFAEGTRATAERRATRPTPHRHLLPPRVGGFGALCDGLGEALAGVVDCTLVYSGDSAQPRTNELTFWEFLSGSVRDVAIHAELIATGEIPVDRAGRARWLEGRWAIKDERIAASARVRA